MSTINVPVTRVSDPNLPCQWKVGRIDLYNNDDEVIWQLDELCQAFPGATFKIVFKSGPMNPVWPNGPFTSPIVSDTLRDSTILRARGRTDNWGLYIYDIWACYGSGDNYPIETPIDPEVDNLMPPPPP